MKNAEVAERLLEIADLLDVLGERFKPEAYRRAARSIESMVEGVDEVAARGGLREVPGVGEAIEGKVQELLKTGSIPYLEKLRREVPNGLRELMRLPGLGPKTARRFWTEFGVEGPAELAEAIRSGRLAGAKGFGERKIAQLKGALETAAVAGPPGARLPIELAYPLARSLLEGLRSAAGVHEIAVAGSFRRGRESVGDLDVLATSASPEKVFDAFSRLPEVREVRLRGPTKETVVLTGGLQVDLRVVEPEAFGAALQYFTGSKDHNVRLRSLARDRGLKINEYGVFRGDERIGGRTEPELYGLLGLDWIPPELREDRGEIALAQAHRLPKLVEASDLRGDLHVHLPPTSGVGELEALVREAKARSFDYLGVVVAAPDGVGGHWLAPATVREWLAKRTDRSPRLLAAVETFEGEPPPADVPFDVRVLRSVATGPATKRPRSEPELPTVVAHLAGTEGPAADRALALARATSASLDVGPGPGRADSSLARAAREGGGRLHVATGVGGPAGDPTLEVALGFARRAGARAEDAANAAPVGQLTRAARPGHR